MQDIVERVREAAAAVDDLPSDLRPAAFKYLLEQLPNGCETDPDAQTGAGLSKPGAAGEKRRSDERGTSRTAAPLNVTSLRQFVGVKRPKNHEQRMAVIAAYLSLDGVNRIGREHIRKAYAALRCKRPRNIEQILCNAHCRKDWFTAVGPDGLRELTEVGRDFVEQLPES